MGKQNQRKYCLFHKDKGYDIEECFTLKKKNRETHR
jgi:hypothetical protein